MYVVRSNKFRLTKLFGWLCEITFVSTKICHVAKKKKGKCPKSFWKRNSAMGSKNMCYSKRVNVLHKCSSFDFRCILKSLESKLMQYNYNDGFAEKNTLLLIILMIYTYEIFIFYLRMRCDITTMIKKKSQF